MRIIREDKSVVFKIVYYGAGLCGKTTNLQQIFRKSQPEQRLTDEIIEIPTQTDKTLTFDLLPLTIGKVASYQAKFSFYTVPGQVHYETSRKLILQDVDGLVFVADSQPQIRDENIRILEEMKNFLKTSHAEDVPTVLQFNKRDLPEIMSVEEMASDLQKADEPWFQASALTGEGVMETMQTILRMTVASAYPKTK